MGGRKHPNSQSPKLQEAKAKKFKLSYRQVIIHGIGWDGLEGSGSLESLGGDSSSLEFEVRDRCRG